MHHAKGVCAWLAEHKDKIELAFLPPYASESNPDEYLNRDLKTALRTGPVSSDKDSLIEKALAFMNQLTTLPEKVRAYFRHPAAAYMRQRLFKGRVNRISRDVGGLTALEICSLSTWNAARVQSRDTGRGQRAGGGREAPASRALRHAASWCPGGHPPAGSRRSAAHRVCGRPRPTGGPCGPRCAGRSGPRSPGP